MLDDINNYLIDREKVKQPILIHIDQEKCSISQNKGETEMKNIRKRKDGRWEIRKVINKKRYSIIKSTQKECIKAFQELNNSITKPTYKPDNNNLYNYSIKWAKLYKENFVSPKQYKDIIRYIEIIKETPIDISINKLTTDKIQKFLNTMEKSRKKEIFITYLNAIIKRIVKDKKLSTNPMEDIIKEPKINKIRQPFTYNEQIQILNELKNTEIKDYILIYLFTGLRKNELNIKEIKNNIENNVLKTICEKKRKSEPVYKYIDLTDKTAELIKNANLKFSIEFVGKEFRKLLNKLKFNKGYGLHTLRHTFTTNQFYLGTPDKYIQEWLGHSKIETTKEHYMTIDRTLSKEKLLKLYPNYYYVIKD